MATISRRFSRSIISLATAYAEQTEDDSLVIPEDLSTLSDEELSALATRAGDAFDALYGDGTAEFAADDLTALAGLTEAIETLAAEQADREAAAAERRSAAEALAGRRNATLAADTAEADVDEDADEDEDEDEDEVAEDAADSTEDEAAANTVTAAGTRGPLNINLARARGRAPKQTRQPQPVAERTIKDVAFAATDGLGFGDRAPIDFLDAGKMLQNRLKNFSASQYQSAASRGQHLRESAPLMGFRRDIPAELTASATPESVDEAMTAAVDQSRLPGGSLTAAGWCAPSEVAYDLIYNESRDGLLSLPEIGISRGGIRVPITPSFADLYSAVGFHFTEAQAIAGEYAPGEDGGANVVGSKPCYEIECPEWEEYRLEGDGLCITADLISMRGYPEMLARVTNGALVAHDHKVSAGRIAKLVAGSTAITMTADTVGTTAPLLAAIELQVEHFRYSQRLSRATTLEGVFPYWVRGAIRQDLSVRLGLALFEVTDSMIDGWFRLRGLVAQYVYDWQALDGDTAANTVTWPDTVQFLLYAAGTWVAGVDDIITLDTLYDSTMLGQNKYTALFTEEAWLVAKRQQDSRIITVPVVSDGTTHAGVLLDGDLAPTAPTAE